MFIVSYKLKRRNLIIAAAVILFGIVLGAYGMIKSGDAGLFNVFKGNERLYNFSNVKTNEDRIKFLKQFQWEVDPKPVEIMEVQLPEEFDAVYKNYNTIQQEVGLDLAKYKGQRVKRYTYKVLNHPTEKKNEVRANVLVYKDKVIAGDIMTTALEGFMQSLIMKKPQP